MSVCLSVLTHACTYVRSSIAGKPSLQQNWLTDCKKHIEKLVKNKTTKKKHFFFLYKRIATQPASPASQYLWLACNSQSHWLGCLNFILTKMVLFLFCFVCCLAHLIFFFFFVFGVLFYNINYKKKKKHINS